MIRATLLLCCLTVSTTSWSQNITVYKCVINGVPTFAQLPCAKDAQAITLKDINVTSAYSNIPKNDDITDTSVDDYLKIQQIERDIKQHQLDIEQYKKSFAEKKQQIGYMTQDKANRLGAASIADAIATKTATLKKTYDALINQKQQQIDALNKQKQQLKVKP
jgi:hypothetical protein